jgi:hypothetical protein
MILIFALFLIATADDAPKSRGSQTTAFAGAWHGDSKCVVRPSGCNDEEALYRIGQGDKPDEVVLSGGKIVNGQEVNMGTGPCRVSSKGPALDCPLPNGSSVHLELKGPKLTGTMTLRDGTLWRKIDLQKEEKK